MGGWVSRALGYMRRNTSAVRRLQEEMILQSTEESSSEDDEEEEEESSYSSTDDENAHYLTAGDNQLQELLQEQQPQEEEEEESAYICRICLSKPSVTTVATICGHLFCINCLHPWLGRRCPCCRHPLRLLSFPFIPVATAPPPPNRTDTSGAPDFSCAACHRMEAHVPVIVPSCGHFYCSSCFQELQLKHSAPGASDDPIWTCSAAGCSGRVRPQSSSSRIIRVFVNDMQESPMPPPPPLPPADDQADSR